ncbi:MAG: hypothetical protein KAT22_02115 [Candidatus Thorarchaeota archaeon]|nr:hypothetical protein [Candidatus Thorarchaeota archaeon]
MITMPIVELVAKKTIANNPDLGLSVIDLIVLLWLYSNPYDSKKRQLSSIRTVLKMCETLQTPGKGIELTDEELTQIVLGSLDRLKGKNLVFIRSAGQHFVKGTLTDAGFGLVRESMNSPSLRRVIAEFGNNP